MCVKVIFVRLTRKGVESLLWDGNVIFYRENFISLRRLEGGIVIGTAGGKCNRKISVLRRNRKALGRLDFRRGDRLGQSQSFGYFVGLVGMEYLRPGDDESENNDQNGCCEPVVAAFAGSAFGGSFPVGCHRLSLWLCLCFAAVV